MLFILLRKIPKMKQPLNCFRGCCQLSFVNRIFLLGNFQSLWLGFSLPSPFGLFVVSFQRHRFSASPSCLWCPLEFLVFAFDPYLFGPNLLAFIALKVLSNNHLHLFFFGLLFVQLSSFGLSVLVCCFCRLQGSYSTDSHQLGFTDASFRFVSLTAPSSSSVSNGCHTAAPHSQVFSAFQRVFCVLPTCGFVPPHWHFEGCGLQSLTQLPIGFCFQHLCLPRCFLSLYGFLPWSAWIPLSLDRLDFILQRPRFALAHCLRFSL